MSGSGQFMEVRIKKESAYGQLAGASGAKIYTRATLDLDLDKAVVRSNRIRTSQQTAVARHGVRKAAGTLTDELACTAFQDLFAAVLRAAWVAGPTSGALTNVTASATAPHFVRAAGSWITDGFRVGMLVRGSGWAAPATANNARNYVIKALTATDMTVAEVGQETATVVAKAAGDSVTLAATGKTLIVPQSGHTKDSFNVERLYLDFTPNRSETIVGAVPTGFTIDVKPDAMVTVAFPFMGKDRIDKDDGAYFTSPSAADTHDTFGSALGLLQLYGSQALWVTGVTLNGAGGHQQGSPILVPAATEIFPGRVAASGTLSGYLVDFSMRNAFRAETEGNLAFHLAAGTAANADVFGITLPRIKVGKVDLPDNESMFVQNIPFEALENVGGTGTDLTTIRLQDTTL